jgi:hypothetical protein
LGPAVLALWNFFQDLKTVSSFYLRLWSFNSIYPASKILPDYNTKNQIFNNCQIICIEFRFLPNLFAKICRRTAKYAVLQLQRCIRSFHDLACSLKACGIRPLISNNFWSTTTALANIENYISSLFTCHIWNMREVLVSWWVKWNFFIADFHVLGLFIAKKHDLSDKFFSVCHAPLPYAKFTLHLQARP